MRDFGAILRKAAEAAKNGGYSGYTGNAENSGSENNLVPPSSAVTSAKTRVVTRVTGSAGSDPPVTTVTTTASAVVTIETSKINELKQRVGKPVTTVTTVTTQNSDPRKNLAPDRPHQSERAQTYLVQCAVCGGRDSQANPLLPICTPIPGHHDWLHSECWPEHVRRVETALRRMAS